MRISDMKAGEATLLLVAALGIAGCASVEPASFPDRTAGLPPVATFPAPLGSAPWPTLGPSSRIQAALSDTSYHLDLWDRQQPVIAAALDHNDATLTAQTAAAVEANGLEWSWVINHPIAAGTLSERANAEVCWGAYQKLTQGLANDLWLYGRDVQAALKSASSAGHWQQATEDLTYFNRYRAVLDEVESESRACDLGGPAPSDVPFLPATPGAEQSQGNG